VRRWLFEKYDDLCWWTKYYARYVREKHVRPWRMWSGHRKHFFETTGWMLADKRFPFFQQMWFRYIFWLAYFANGYLKLYRDDLKRITTKTYCRIADKLLGGNRIQQFDELRKQKLAKLKEENQRRKNASQEQDALLFRMRLQNEARQNPNFVATNHTHQDR